MPSGRIPHSNRCRFRSSDLASGLLLAFVALGTAACGGGGGGPRLMDVTGDWQITLLAFGDSITRGVGDGNNELATPAVSVAGYPARLIAILGLPVINAGKGGERTVAGLPRLTATLVANPEVDYVIILEGVNDLLDNGSDEEAQAETLENLRGMIQVVLGMGRIPVIGTLTPICCNQEFSIDAADVASLNDGIRNLAFEFPDRPNRFL